VALTATIQWCAPFLSRVQLRSAAYGVVLSSIHMGCSGARTPLPGARSVDADGPAFDLARARSSASHVHAAHRYLAFLGERDVAGAAPKLDGGRGREDELVL